MQIANNKKYNKFNNKKYNKLEVNTETVTDT